MYACHYSLFFSDLGRWSPAQVIYANQQVIVRSTCAGRSSGFLNARHNKLQMIRKTPRMILGPEASHVLYFSINIYLLTDPLIRPVVLQMLCLCFS